MSVYITYKECVYNIQLTNSFNTISQYQITFLVNQCFHERQNKVLYPCPSQLAFSHGQISMMIGYLQTTTFSLFLRNVILNHGLLSLNINKNSKFAKQLFTQRLSVISHTSKAINGGILELIPCLQLPNLQLLYDNSRITSVIMSLFLYQHTFSIKQLFALNLELLFLHLYENNMTRIAASKVH